MSTEERAGLGVDAGIRTLLLLMPRVVGRAKKLGVPKELESFSLAPRHLSLLANLVFDGPTTVTDLAARLEVAPTTVSLMVAELSKQGVLERGADPADRRRTIVAIAPAHEISVHKWLGRSARAWRAVLEPLTPQQRKLFVDTFRAFEAQLAADD
ncbi:MarR family winged helix-turn-helix transcriptional regulator [Nocardia implantans]|uniref:MarR family winged helix-turn-helix transcriptional regulator n=1 Tax=Nocardia implantans TaxID=3108168 RepID=A0ABU6B3V5_9NOCA|nr:MULTISPECIES: MarR family winged helix-turn-helix transcriptional regulator [unclassified Nocardia]MBF6196039.1 winged helix-turn-helix transcriptional regulator [Nocardia beijingensis]MEA3532588.1 MarR family winged helix-turn-helix transcriptional regulator [Nocardia sp. CDC192]MEB3514379.1 MarR family winged helix-turn-helix transcriptional regulator [Nocardia sp. CDC186]